MSSRFSEQADLYAQFRPNYPKEVYEFIVDHLHAKNKAWDCATGSGQEACHLAEKFAQVIATDISEEQLQHAPDLPNITYKVASAEDSGLPTNHFDLITVAQAIHWFDFEQFYNEMRRVAREDALLAVIGYSMISINDEVDPPLEALYEEAFGTYFNENRQYLDDHYRSIPFPFEEIQAPEFKYTVEWNIDDLAGYFNSWSAIQKMKTDQNYNPVPSTIDKLKARLADLDRITVTFPVFIRLGYVNS